MRKSNRPLIRRRPLGRLGKLALQVQRVRKHPFPNSVESPHFLYRSDAALKAHPSYRAAKAGNGDAAIQLVGDLASPLIASLLETDLPRSCIYVAPHAKEAEGDNAIPHIFAVFLLRALGGVIDESIVQVNKVFHTGADPMERMYLRADFSGYVVPGGEYVLVDDVTTMGGTLAELADYIQAHRGKVVGAIVLVSAGRSGRLVAPSKAIHQLERRYGDEICKIFGIATHALTADEAGYLIGFRTLDEIRGRLAKARQETSHRLGSKGIQLDGPERQVVLVAFEPWRVREGRRPIRRQNKKPRLK